MDDKETPTKSDETASWQYNPSSSEADNPQAPETSGTSAQPPSGSGSSVTWTASEYVDHERGFGWYLALALGSVILAALIYLLTKELFAIVVILAVGAIVGVHARGRPQQVTYEISSSGLRVGEKTYSYSLFKSFSVIRDGGLNSISLLPLKRFMPPVSAYFESPDEDKIVGTLSDYLPYEERKADSIDRLSRRLKL